MNYSDNNTAILLFTRSANREAQLKNFVANASFKRNVAVSNRLFLEVHSKCINAGLPVFHLDENSQKGSNFAERLKYSFQHVFNQGYDNVIAVGNDCPMLSVDDIKVAAEKLASGSSVLGQTQKGGVYLFALSINAFQKLDLNEIVWNSNTVFSQLKSSLNASSGTYLLERKSEYNSEMDCDEFSLFLNNELSNWLLAQVNKPKANFGEFLSSILYDYSEIEENRGPPRV